MESLYVGMLCMTVLLMFSTTAHPIDFTLGACIAEDPRKCTVVKCEVVWMSVPSHFDLTEDHLHLDCGSE